MLQKNFTSMKRLSFDEIIIIIIKLEWKLYKFKVKPPYRPKSLTRLQSFATSVRRSHAGVVSKRLNASSSAPQIRSREFWGYINLYVCIYYITQSVLGLYDSLWLVSHTKCLGEILLGLFLTEAPNTGKVVETRKARHNLYVGHPAVRPQTQ